MVRPCPPSGEIQELTDEEIRELMRPESFLNEIFLQAAEEQAPDQNDDVEGFDFLQAVTNYHSEETDDPVPTDLNTFVIPGVFAGPVGCADFSAIPDLEEDGVDEDDPALMRFAQKYLPEFAAEYFENMDPRDFNDLKFAIIQGIFFFQRVTEARVLWKEIKADRVTDVLKVPQAEYAAAQAVESLGDSYVPRPGSVMDSLLREVRRTGVATKEQAMKAVFAAMPAHLERVGKDPAKMNLWLSGDELRAVQTFETLKAIPKKELHGLLAGAAILGKKFEIPKDSEMSLHVRQSARFGELKGHARILGAVDYILKEGPRNAKEVMVCKAYETVTLDLRRISLREASNFLEDDYNPRPQSWQRQKLAEYEARGVAPTHARMVVLSNIVDKIRAGDLKVADLSPQEAKAYHAYKEIRMFHGVFDREFEALYTSSQYFGPGYKPRANSQARYAYDAALESGSSPMMARFRMIQTLAEMDAADLTDTEARAVATYKRMSFTRQSFATRNAAKILERANYVPKPDWKAHQAMTEATTRGAPLRRGYMKAVQALLKVEETHPQDITPVERRALDSYHRVMNGFANEGEFRAAYKGGELLGKGYEPTRGTVAATRYNHVLSQGGTGTEARMAAVIALEDDYRRVNDRRISKIEVDAYRAYEHASFGGDRVALQVGTELLPEDYRPRAQSRFRSQYDRVFEETGSHAEARRQVLRAMSELSDTEPATRALASLSADEQRALALYEQARGHDPRRLKKLFFAERVLDEGYVPGESSPARQAYRQALGDTGSMRFARMMAADALYEHQKSIETETARLRELSIYDSNGAPKAGTPARAAWDREMAKAEAKAVAAQERYGQLAPADIKKQVYLDEIYAGRKRARQAALDALATEYKKLSDVEVSAAGAAAPRSNGISYDRAASDRLNGTLLGANYRRASKLFARIYYVNGGIQFGLNALQLQDMESRGVEDADFERYLMIEMASDTINIAYRALMERAKMHASNGDFKSALKLTAGLPFFLRCTTLLSFCFTSLAFFYSEYQRNGTDFEKWDWALANRYIAGFLGSFSTFVLECYRYYILMTAGPEALSDKDRYMGIRNQADFKGEELADIKKADPNFAKNWVRYKKFANYFGAGMSAIGFASVAGQLGVMIKEFSEGDKKEGYYVSLGVMSGAVGIFSGWVRRLPAGRFPSTVLSAIAVALSLGQLAYKHYGYELRNSWAYGLDMSRKANHALAGINMMRVTPTGMHPEGTLPLTANELRHLGKVARFDENDRGNTPYLEDTPSFNYIARAGMVMDGLEDISRSDPEAFNSADYQLKLLSSIAYTANQEASFCDDSGFSAGFLREYLSPCGYQLPGEGLSGIAFLVALDVNGVLSPEFFSAEITRFKDGREYRERVWDNPMRLEIERALATKEAEFVRQYVFNYSENQHSLANIYLWSKGARTPAEIERSMREFPEEMSMEGVDHHVEAVRLEVRARFGHDFDPDEPYNPKVLRQWSEELYAMDEQLEEDAETGNKFRDPWEVDEEMGDSLNLAAQLDRQFEVMQEQLMASAESGELQEAEGLLQDLQNLTEDLIPGLEYNPNYDADFGTG